MECRDYEERRESMARGPCAVGLQLNFSSERGVPLAIASRMPRKPARPVVLDPPPGACDPTYPSYHLPDDIPFMNDMDEISYWIHTKRAPCLMNYDNIIKKQNEDARCSKMDIKPVTETALSPRKKKKKRKLSLLDDDLSSGKQQNVYFEVSQKNNQPLVNNCKSDSLGSDIDFNIKNTSVGEKPKRVRLQKSNRTRLHKKNKVVTSTPKTTVNLRRSLRQAQLNNSQLNNSFEILNASVTNGAIVKHIINPDQKHTEKVNKTEFLAGGDQTANKTHTSQRNKSKNTTHVNGMFEDFSDVSGFTANYIRSTKVQSSKTPRKLHGKTTRNLAKELQQTPQNNSDMIVCVNKSVNTGLPEPNMLNCSTDSSQNVMNLVTSKNDVKPIKLDKSTSLLKFMDTKGKNKEAVSKADGRKSKSNLNVSFQSQSSGTPRYPKRQRNHRDITNNTDVNRTSMDTRRRCNKNCLEFNNSDKKENPEEKVVSRTRSGRSATLTAQQRENSVLVVSNSTEQMSSMVSMNVASPPLAKQRNKRRPARQARAKKSVNRGAHSTQKDSLRDKSGFAACFSESDDDSVPLVQRKYFCT